MRTIITGFVIVVSATGFVLFVGVVWLILRRMISLLRAWLADHPGRQS